MVTTDKKEEKDLDLSFVKRGNYLRTYGQKKITNCKHTEAKHYAKGMCNSCYHRHGRSKKANLCAHKDRLMYAKGKCHACYILTTIKNAKQNKKSPPSSKKTSMDTVATNVDVYDTVTEDELEA